MNIKQTFFKEFYTTYMDYWRVYYFDDADTKFDKDQIQYSYQYLKEKFRSLHAKLVLFLIFIDECYVRARLCQS